jgi:hypothetical protein
MMIVLPVEGVGLTDEVIPPLINYATPSMCSLLGYPPVRTSHSHRGIGLAHKLAHELTCGDG